MFHTRRKAKAKEAAKTQQLALKSAGEPRSVKLVLQKLGGIVGPSFYKLVEANNFQIIFSKKSMPSEVMEAILNEVGQDWSAENVIECRCSTVLQKELMRLISEAQMSGRGTITKRLPTMYGASLMPVTCMPDPADDDDTSRIFVGDLPSGKRLGVYQSTQKYADAMSRGERPEGLHCVDVNGHALSDEDTERMLAVAQLKWRNHERFALRFFISNLLLELSAVREGSHLEVRDGGLGRAHIVGALESVVGAKRNAHSSSPFPSSTSGTARQYNECVPFTQEALAAFAVVRSLAGGAYMPWSASAARAFTPSPCRNNPIGKRIRTY